MGVVFLRRKIIHIKQELCGGAIQHGFLLDFSDHSFLNGLIEINLSTGKVPPSFTKLGIRPFNDQDPA
jgi:hypothetical protein